MEFDWLTFVGVAGGLIGAVSGVAGVAIAISADRRAKAVKSLDLRIEARRAQQTALVTLESLAELRT